MFVQTGDTVIMLGHTGVSKGDRSSRIPVVHLGRLCGEGEVCRLQILTATLEGARVLGIVPEAEG